MRTLIVFSLLLLAACASPVADAGAGATDAMVEGVETGAAEPAGPIKAPHVVLRDGEVVDLRDPAWTGSKPVDLARSLGGVGDPAFGQLRLTGASKGDPDTYLGRGIIVLGRKNVTIRGGCFSKFKVAIYAEDCENLTIEGCVFVDNFRERLTAAQALDVASNDHDQWRENHGAAIYLKNCRNAVVRDCHGRKGQNGVVLSRCENCAVIDCDFSYHSGWGCALWRSSNNEISGNRFDHCVRGRTSGLFTRGEGSAGVYMLEQCNDNVVAFNSMLCCGTGIYLTMDRDTKSAAAGGLRNVVWRNDARFSLGFSASIYETDSTDLIGNRFGECEAGIRLWLCDKSFVLDNHITRATVAGIGCEGGQGHVIAGNRLEWNKCGIWLLSRHNANSGTEENREFDRDKSSGHVVQRNQLSANSTAIRVQSCSNVTIELNEVRGCDVPIHALESLAGIEILNNDFHGGAFDWDGKEEAPAGVWFGVNWARDFDAGASEPFEPLKGGVVATLPERVVKRVAALRNNLKQNEINDKQPAPKRSDIRLGTWGPLEPGEK